MRKYFFHSFWNSHSLSLETMRCYKEVEKPILYVIKGLILSCFILM